MRSKSSVHWGESNNCFYLWVFNVKVEFSLAKSSIQTLVWSCFVIQSAHMFVDLEIARQCTSSMSFARAQIFNIVVISLHCVAPYLICWITIWESDSIVILHHRFSLSKWTPSWIGMAFTVVISSQHSFLFTPPKIIHSWFLATTLMPSVLVRSLHDSSQFILTVFWIGFSHFYCGRF